MRQGGLISPQLFLAVANEFLIKHENLDHINARLKGYADDFVFISNSVVKMKSLINDFEVFCKNNNLFINPKKCAVMYNSNAFISMHHFQAFILRPSI